MEASALGLGSLRRGARRSMVVWQWTALCGTAEAQCRQSAEWSMSVASERAMSSQVDAWRRAYVGGGGSERASGLGLSLSLPRALSSPHQAQP